MKLAGKIQKPLHPPGTKGHTDRSWFHPHFAHTQTDRAKCALIVWPVTVACRDALFRSRAERFRRRASGWYSPYENRGWLSAADHPSLPVHTGYSSRWSL